MEKINSTFNERVVLHNTTQAVSEQSPTHWRASASHRRKLIHKTQRIKIADIIIPERKRQINENKVRELTESIKISGLLQPVVVTTERILVAGAHRLAACRQLGITEISATVIDSAEAQKELAEIEENLVRHSLTALERCFQLRRRKELYEAINPQSARGKYDRGKSKAKAEAAENEVNGKIAAPENKSKNDSPVAYENTAFTAAAAREAKVTARTVQREISVAAKLAPEVVEAIREHSIANRANQLYELSRFPPAAQKEITRLMIEKNEPFASAARQVSETCCHEKAVTNVNQAEQTANSTEQLKLAENNSPTEAGSPACPDKQLQIRHLFRLIKELAEFQFQATTEDLSMFVEWQSKVNFDFELTPQLERYFTLFGEFAIDCSAINFDEEMPTEASAENELAPLTEAMNQFYSEIEEHGEIGGAGKEPDFDNRAEGSLAAKETSFENQKGSPRLFDDDFDRW
jgi:disulfide oxidoreductase YuzD